MYYDFQSKRGVQDMRSLAPATGLHHDDHEVHLSIYVVPADIFAALQSANALKDFQCYSKIRPYLSLSDLGTLCILNGDDCLRDHSSLKNRVIPVPIWSSSLLNTWRYSDDLEEGHLNEINHTLAVMKGDRQKRLDVVNGLLKEPDTGSEFACAGLADLEKPEPAPVKYRILLQGETIYIVVEEGFLSSIEGDKTHLAFLTHLLKAAYSVYSIECVNSSTLYRQYVKALLGVKPDA